MDDGDEDIPTRWTRVDGGKKPKGLGDLAGEKDEEFFEGKVDEGVVPGRENGDDGGQKRLPGGKERRRSGPLEMEREPVAAINGEGGGVGYEQTLAWLSSQRREDWTSRGFVCGRRKGGRLLL